MSLAQMISGTDITDPPWEALRFFVYAAICSNLVAAGCSLWTIFALDNVAVKAQRLAMADNRSLPYKVLAGQPIGREIHDRKLLLKLFGADPYWWQSFGAMIWYMLGLLLTFMALITWMWVSQSKAVATGVTVMATQGILGLVYPIAEGVYDAFTDTDDDD